MKGKTDANQQKFRGFQSPTTTPIPDEVFDRLLPDLSGAELKVLLYICRRTFGFKKESDTISLHQIAEGITTREGRVLDAGTGLSKRHVQRALKHLEAKQIVEVTRTVAEDGVNEINVYALHFAAGVGTKSPYGRDKRSPRVGTPMSPTRNSRQQTGNIPVSNGDVSIFKKLSTLAQPKERTEYITNLLTQQLKDAHSKPFYHLIATKVPEQVIRQALAELKADGAREPAKLFTHKMKRYALQHYKERIGESGGFMTRPNGTSSQA